MSSLKFFKTIAFLLLSVLTVFSLFIGCSKDDDDDDVVVATKTLTVDVTYDSTYLDPAPTLIGGTLYVMAYGADQLQGEPDWEASEALTLDAGTVSLEIEDIPADETVYFYTFIDTDGSQTISGNEFVEIYDDVPIADTAGTGADALMAATWTGVATEVIFTDNAATVPVDLNKYVESVASFNKLTAVITYPADAEGQTLHIRAFNADEFYGAPAAMAEYDLTAGGSPITVEFGDLAMDLQDSIYLSIFTDGEDTDGTYGATGLDDSEYFEFYPDLAMEEMHGSYSTGSITGGSPVLFDAETHSASIEVTLDKRYSDFYQNTLTLNVTYDSTNLNNQTLNGKTMYATIFTEDEMYQDDPTTPVASDANYPVRSQSVVLSADSGTETFTFTDAGNDTVGYESNTIYFYVWIDSDATPSGQIDNNDPFKIYEKAGYNDIIVGTDPVWAGAKLYTDWDANTATVNMTLDMMYSTLQTPCVLTVTVGLPDDAAADQTLYLRAFSDNAFTTLVGTQEAVVLTADAITAGVQEIVVDDITGAATFNREDVYFYLFIDPAGGDGEPGGSEYLEYYNDFAKADIDAPAPGAGVTINNFAATVGSEDSPLELDKKYDDPFTPKVVINITYTNISGGKLAAALYEDPADAVMVCWDDIDVSEGDSGTVTFVIPKGSIQWDTWDSTENTAYLRIYTLDAFGSDQVPNVDYNEWYNNIGTDNAGVPTTTPTAIDMTAVTIADIELDQFFPAP